MKYRVEILFDAPGDAAAVEYAEEMVRTIDRGGVRARSVEMGDVDAMKMRWDYERGVVSSGQRMPVSS